MTKPTILDPGCHRPYCTGETDQATLGWPDWATPRSDWRLVETIQVSGGRL